MNCKIDIKKDGKLFISYLPFDPKVEFNISKGTIYAKCLIGKNEFKTKLMSKGKGKYFIIFNKELQKELGLEEKEYFNISLKITPDTVSIPELAEPELLKNETLKTIVERVSIRKFTGKKISKIYINTILNAGFCAPSANNKRPFHFIVTENNKKMLRIIGDNSKVKLLENTTVCIIICGDKVVQGISEFLLNDCSAATQNMLLAIHSIGLGGVWCGIKQNSEFYKNIIREFKLPRHIRPISLIALGYTNENKIQQNRYEINKVHYECW
jgi:nitroreductase